MFAQLKFLRFYLKGWNTCEQCNISLGSVRYWYYKIPGLWYPKRPQSPILCSKECFLLGPLEAILWLALYVKAET